ncbi:MAG TPA: hypothetical protein PLF62_01675 [Clostridia bacterium]|nr:hypothetical protein [Clostridia bacterium]
MKKLITILITALLIAAFGCQKKAIPVKDRYTQINIGAPDAGAGDNLYTAFTKVNANFAAVDDSLELKAPIANPNFTGVARLNTTDTLATRAYARAKGGGSSEGEGVWGGITGTLSDQTDLQSALNAKAPTVSPTFTTSATLPAATSIGDVSSTEISYLDGASSNIQAQLNDTTTLDYAFNSQTGTTYTLALTDNYGIVTLTNASSITLTVPPNSSVAFPVGANITIIALGAGQVTVKAGSGVTIRSAGSDLKLTEQYSTATLIKIATDTWLLVGDITT